MSDRIRIIKHEAVPQCGSFEVRFPDDRPSQYFYWDDIPARRMRPEWQTAIEVLLLVSRGGPTMMARIGVMKALNRHVERVFNPERKDHHWGKRKLKRDQ